MAYTLTLDNARTKLVYLAAIDGKNGANGRHSPANQGLILNMVYRELMSRAGALGLPHGLTTSTGTLGSQASGEDYISLDFPTAAAEVVGVDVKGGHTGAQWRKLDPLVWEQRRDISPGIGDPRGYFQGGLLPPGGIGFWATREAPSVSGATLTAGKLAIWPTRLAGLSYTLSQVRQWVEITSGTDVFLLHEGWETWFINKAVMAVTQRDTNKRGNYETAQAAWMAADLLLEAQAARHNRAGSFEPTPYGGISL
jgi:hypothetical protein